jgi:phosphonate transport system substrate-binding protein
MRSGRLISALWLLLALAMPATAQPEPIRFSMMPRFYPEKIASMIGPLIVYLSGKTGLQFVDVPASNNADFESHIRGGQIDIGFENPILYARLSDVHEVALTASEGEGSGLYRGIVLTQSGSSLQRLQDLKNKNIMTVGETSGGGYLSQKIALAEMGIALDSDCRIETAADNKQENVIIAVSIGEVEAGFVRESALRLADKFIQPGSIRVMGYGAWLPGWALSMKKKFPEDKKRLIINALLELKSDDPVLKALEVTGFAPITDAYYEPLRKSLTPSK